MNLNRLPDPADYQPNITRGYLMRHSVFPGMFAMLVLLLVISPLPVIGGDIKIQSVPISGQLLLDGQIAHWPDSAATFLSEQESVVGLCNDSEHLYVMLRFKNPRYARLIHFTGLTVYVDARGKKKKDFVLKFTGGPTRDQIRQIGGTEERRRNLPSDTTEPPESIGNSSQNKLTCFQKDVIVEKEIPLDGSEGPGAVFAVDKGFFVYEFSIPLDSSTVRHYGVGATPGSEISVGLLWGEPGQRPEGRPDRGGIEMGGPGGGDFGGGFGGGRMGGGRRGERSGGSGEGFSRPAKQEVWIKAELAGSGHKP